MYSLDHHYVTLPGWLYRAFRNETILIDIFPEQIAVGLCWYEYSPGARIVGRSDRLCNDCAYDKARINPMCCLAKYLDTKIYNKRDVITMALSLRNHWCTNCRKTLFAIRADINDVFIPLDDYLREVHVPHIENAMNETMEGYDSGIET